MGQYYFPTCIETKQHLYSHDYDSGLKLMEHSWANNEFVRAVMGLLTPKGAWYKKRLVWAGDYGDMSFEDFVTDPVEDVIRRLGDRVIITEEITDENKIKPTPIKSIKNKFIVDHTQKLFVDMNKLSQHSDRWTINPLPLLTSNGNGQGGGDYDGSDMHLVGSWAAHIISVETKRTLPKDYVELKTNFTEER
jgi:hypothetical protein